jgi:hypothetical protein
LIEPNFGPVAHDVSPKGAHLKIPGGNWAIKRSDGLDCIEYGWLTEDYYLTDLGKKILNTLSR